MQEPTPLTPAERELEAALASLRPAATHIQRDRLMFEAGRASVRKPVRRWQAASGALAAALALTLVFRPAVPTNQPIAPVVVQAGSQPQPQAQPQPLSPRMAVVQLPVGSPGPAAYGLVRDRVLARGLEALPNSSFSSHDSDDPEPRLQRLQQISPSTTHHWKLFRMESLLPPGEQS